MNHLIDLQIAVKAPLPVGKADLVKWINCALNEHSRAAELTLRVVENDEIVHLNYHYRHINKPTNVLAFASDLPAHVTLAHDFLGDVIICPAVLQQESISQKQPLIFHWAHIVVHGVLHLLGFDHLNDNDTLIMQTQEAKILSQLGFGHPYHNKEYYIE